MPDCRDPRPNAAPAHRNDGIEAVAEIDDEPLGTGAGESHDVERIFQVAPGCSITHS